MATTNSTLDMSLRASPQVPSRSDSLRQRHTSVGRVFKRLRSAIQRIGGSNKESNTPQQSPATPSETPIGTPEVDDDPEDVCIVPGRDMENDRNILELEPAIEIKHPTAPGLIRQSVQRERTRALFEKYGLSIEAHEWVPTSPTSLSPHSVQRVEKPIRMRIRYICHVCQSTFGATRQCKKCQHTRCSSCIRSPPIKKPRSDEDKESSIVTESDWDSDGERGRRRARKFNSRDESPMARTSKEILEESQPVLQRNRRNCHKCETVFPAGTTQVCLNCGHLRCSRCPRELTHLVWSCGKDAKEGDSTEAARPSAERVYRKPRQRLRWLCDHCQTVFLEGSKVCRDCLHQRCDFCTRIPPKRVKLDPDPGSEVVQSVQARLADLTIPHFPTVASTG